MGHAIRFRGGWTLSGGNLAAAADKVRPERFTLPCVWPSEIAGVVRLERRFQTPPLDTACERPRLRLDAVAGLISADLNGESLGVVGPSDHALDLAVALPPRASNVLTLEVDVEAASAHARGKPWGEVALVIEPIVAI